MTTLSDADKLRVLSKNLLHCQILTEFSGRSDVLSVLYIEGVAVVIVKMARHKQAIQGNRKVQLKCLPLSVHVYLILSVHKKCGHDRSSTNVPINVSRYRRKHNEPVGSTKPQGFLCYNVIKRDNYTR